MVSAEERLHSPGPDFIELLPPGSSSPASRGTWTPYARRTRHDARGIPPTPATRAIMNATMPIRPLRRIAVAAST